MSFNFKTLIRNTLVDDATIRTELNASATGSASVFPYYSQAVTGIYAGYPRITFQEICGPTLPGLDAERGILSLQIFVRASGTTSPVVKIERIRDRLIAILDDTFISATAYTYLLLKQSEIEDYDSEERTHRKIMNFLYVLKQA